MCFSSWSSVFSIFSPRWGESLNRWNARLFLNPGLKSYRFFLRGQSTCSCCFVREKGKLTLQSLVPAYTQNVTFRLPGPEHGSPKSLQTRKCKQIGECIVLPTVVEPPLSALPGVKIILKNHVHTRRNALNDRNTT